MKLSAGQFLFCKHEKLLGSNKVNMVDVTTLVGTSKIALLKMLCGKAHYHYAKSTCAFKYWISFDAFSVVNVLKLKVKDLVDCLGGTS
jgi:hypothetical protein